MTRDLAKCYVGEDKIMQCLDRQKVFFEEGGLFGIFSRRHISSCSTNKTNFVKNNGKHCNKCKNLGNLQKDCNIKDNSTYKKIGN